MLKRFVVLSGIALQVILEWNARVAMELRISSCAKSASSVYMVTKEKNCKGYAFSDPGWGVGTFYWMHASSHGNWIRKNDHRVFFIFAYQLKWLAAPKSSPWETNQHAYSGITSNYERHQRVKLPIESTRLQSLVRRSELRIHLGKKPDTWVRKRLMMEIGVRLPQKLQVLQEMRSLFPNLLCN